jgi:hypothetical protein
VEDWEVLALAEERGEVRRQRVDERLELFRRLFEEGEVGGEGAEAVLADPLADARVDQLLLRRRQGDAGVLVDQLADGLEVLAGELKLTPALHQKVLTASAPTASNDGARRGEAALSWATLKVATESRSARA